MKQWIAWGIALIASGVAGWSLTREPPAPPPPPPEQPPEQVAEGEPAIGVGEGGPGRSGGAKGGGGGPPSLRATQLCLGQLETMQFALARCRAGQPKGSPSEAGCLADPQVAAVVEQRIEAAVSDHVEEERDRKAQARERERSAFDAWASEALKLTTDESQWVEDYTCAARELRERTLASLQDTPPVEALERLRAQRKQLLADMKDMLGDERYDELRAIGGIGLVADTTVCP